MAFPLESSAEPTQPSESVQPQECWCVPFRLDSLRREDSLRAEDAILGEHMAGRPDNEPSNVTPIARYADRECSGCGIILPANQMVRVNDQVLTGFTKNRRNYSSTRGTFGSGGSTSKRYRVETVDLCPACADRRQRSKRASGAGTAIGFIIVVVLALFVIGAIFGHGSGSTGAPDASSATDAASPQDVGNQASEAPASDSPAADPSSGPALDASSTTAATPAPGQLTTAQPAENAGTNDGPASVDCVGEGNCSNPTLRDQSNRITWMYRTLVARAAPEQRAQFAQEQSAWVAERAACTTDECVTAAFDKRLRAVTAEAWAQYHAQHDGGGPSTTFQ